MRSYSDDITIEKNTVIYEEQQSNEDMILMPLPTGRRYFGARGIFHMNWALSKYDMVYYMRLDDDSFPCLQKILYELNASMPRSRYLWTKYWHQNKRTRVDENFLVLTPDLAKFIIDGTKSGILPVDYKVDFGINFTFWLQFLKVQIFDDQGRLDSQQALLTKVMHLNPQKTKLKDDDKRLKSFCIDYIYAHHVHPGLMDMLFPLVIPPTQYELPSLSSPTDMLYSVDTDFFSANFPNCICYSVPCFHGNCTKNKKSK